MRSMIVVLICSLLSLCTLSYAGTQDPLSETFKNPPDVTRPWCYWYWISDNISREGITKDLEAMAQVGIGTALIGNQWFKDQPQGPVSVLSDEWWDLTVYAVLEAKRVGVDIGMFNCPGWSQSGGPWVQPNQSMRYLAHSEIRVNGGQKVSIQLPEPGKDFQDVALLALPMPAGEDQPLVQRSPQIQCQPELSKAEVLVDGDLKTAIALPGGKQNKPLQLDIRVAEPFVAQSITLTPGPGAFRTQGEIQAWIDGAYKTLRSFKYDRRNPSVNVGPMPRGPVMVSLPPTRSDRFRLILSPRQGSGQLAEINVSPAACVEYAIEKQLGKVHPTPLPIWGDYLWPEVSEPLDKSFIVPPQQIIDLTGSLDSDGRLVWDAPAGNWIVQRIGMLPTGTKNSPAAPHAQGPEIDKINRQHLASHFEAFIGKLLQRLAPDERSAFKYVVADSYEMGPQNWTDGMRESFQKTYGYDPIPYLPVLSGRVVNGATQSDRFLWDLRRLVADRVAEEYVGGLRDLCVANNLQMWLENYGHWGFPGEFMRYGGQCNLIGGEFWVTGSLGNIECRAAASTAHAYGKPIVYAEAFTSGDNWVYTPYNLKARGDWAFTEGINHFVLHVYIQQPRDDFIPGMNAWFGTEFNRHNTWFFEGKDWIDYLRRCHVMLQQGAHVADFAYFIGEDTPIMTGTRQPEQPAGYDFDFVNAEVLLERMDVRDGHWCLPDGKRYAILILPPLPTMRPLVLQRLHDLVKKGGILYGEAPLRSPSLQGWPQADQKVKTLVRSLWQDLQPGQTGRRLLGLGKVIQGETLTDVLRTEELVPDLAEVDPREVLWTHRRTADRDIYFVSNQKAETVNLSPVFRVPEKHVPEFWYADTGRIERTGRYEIVEQGKRVPLTLSPAGSVFVVFRKTTAPLGPSITQVTGPGPVQVSAGVDRWLAIFEQAGSYRLARQGGGSVSVQVPPLRAPVMLDGPWSLTFTAGRDVPAEIQLDTLGLWTDQMDEAVRHYSGTATYHTHFEFPVERLRQGDLRFELDLGDVHPMARVLLNGQDLGLLWKPPYRLDITEYLRPGRNTLALAVTNLWNNRLLGELKYPEGFPERAGKREFQARSSIRGKMNTKRHLQPSGLAGPIQIRSSVVRTVK